MEHAYLIQDSWGSRIQEESSRAQRGAWWKAGAAEWMLDSSGVSALCKPWHPAPAMSFGDLAISITVSWERPSIVQVGKPRPRPTEDRGHHGLFSGSPCDLCQPLNKALDMFFQEGSPLPGARPQSVTPRDTQTETQRAPNLSFLKHLHFHCSCLIRSCACGAEPSFSPSLYKNSTLSAWQARSSPAPVRQPSCPFLANNGQHLPHPPEHPRAALRCG